MRLVVPVPVPVLVLVLVVALGACGTAPAAMAPVHAAPAKAAPERLAVVRGRVLGSRIAHVRVIGRDGKLGAAQAVAADGSFALSMAATAATAATKETLVRFQVTGVDRRPETIAVATAELPVDVTVRLGGDATAPTGGRAGVVVHDPAGEPKSTRFVEQPDGTLRASIALPDGTHRYRVWGFNHGEPINGTSSDGYELADDGTYYAIAIASGGSASITIDPKKRAAASHASEVVFAKADGPSAGVTRVLQRVERTRAAVMERALAALEKGQRPVDGPDAWTAMHGELAGIAREDPNVVVRVAAAVAYFAEGNFAKPTEAETRMARSVLEQTLPDDPIWSLFRSLANVLDVAADRARGDAYAAAFRETQPDTDAVGGFLITTLYREKDKSRARDVYRALQAERFKGTEHQSMSSQYDPDRASAPGSDVAPFEVQAIGAKKAHTAKSLAGKAYLVDIWATWCQPCVAELPELHKLYAEHGRKRLEILSISLDSSPDDVVKFRQDKAHPMPWLQGFAGSEAKAVKLLSGSESPPVPFYVLVGGDGKVIASSPHLDVDDIPSLLDRQP